LKYCKQQHSVASNRSWGSPDGSVVFCMSDDPDGQIRTVETGIQNAENNYVGIHGELETFGEYLDCFTEFRARAMDSDTTDSGESILDDPDIYHWRCAFCPAVVNTQAELETHINSLHQRELFLFRCDTCGFLAKGPKYLRRHKRSVHNNRGDGEYPQSGGDSDVEDHNPFPQPDNKVSSTSEDPGVPKREVVTLRVRDLSDSSGGDVREIVTLKVVNLISGGPDSNFWCPTCQTSFGSEEAWDYHEPCPKDAVAVGAQGARSKVAERSRDTDSLMDHILCRYCLRHCKDTILHPQYKRTECPPRISDKERDRLRKERPSTTTNFENGQASSATPAHSQMCPGLNEVGVKGFCSFNRHILNASETPNNLEDSGREKATAARVVSPHKTRAAFTNARVVSTRTTFGRNYAGEDDESSHTGLN
jgi:hypothetical protein